MPAPISVVIPTYRGARFIAATIRSVQAQTLPVSETIVVDDGSPDDSAEHAARAGATVIRQENRGQAAARNTGIIAASQPWIALLDHDDIWDPHKIERQWEAHLLRPEIDVIACDFRMSDGHRIIAPSGLAVHAGYHTLARTRLDRPDLIEASSDAAAASLAVANWALPSSLLIRKAALERVGLFDEDMRLCEDYILVFRLLHASGVLVVEDPLLSYLCFTGKNVSSDMARMIFAELDMGERILREPDRYPPALPELVRSRRTSALYFAALQDAKVGRTERFHSARRDIPIERRRVAFIAAIALLAGNPLTRPLFAGLRMLWYEAKRVRNHLAARHVRTQ